MTNSKIDFIKGHMGGNEIVLLYGDHIPPDMELAAGVSALKAPSLRGDSAGVAVQDIQIRKSAYQALTA